MTSPLSLLILSFLTVSSHVGLEEVFFSPQDRAVRERDEGLLQCISGKRSPGAGITMLKDVQQLMRSRPIPDEYGGGKQMETSLLEGGHGATHPSVTLRPQLLMVTQGARVVMHCEVTGNPLPSIRWVKRGKSKQTGGKIKMGVRNATLSIQSAQSYDDGIYVCEASNTLGSSQNSARLTVAVSPIIVKFTPQVTSKVGDSVILPCRAVGIQVINYTWSRSTKEQLGNLGEAHVDHDGSLHISRVQRSDAGDYFCTAENRAGRQRRGSTLFVTGEETHTQEDLSATSSRQPISTSSGISGEEKAKTVHKEILCSEEECEGTAVLFSRGLVGQLKILPGSRDSHPMTTSPTFVTQMQPPTVISPPHPNAQSVIMSPETSASDAATVRSLSDETRDSLDSFTTVNPIPSASSPVMTTSPTGAAYTHSHPFARDSERYRPSTQASTSSVSNPPQAQKTSQPFLTTASPRQSTDSHILSQKFPRRTTESITHPSHPFQSYNSTHDTDLSDWSKSNTSQSQITSNSNTRPKQQPESWLLTLEMHDIPIVVGVGLSLAFIFTTVAFYSVVQKNEPTQTNRAAQRNHCVPMRKAEDQTVGQTYENSAFEDDRCMAIIEQTPNISYTRARLPGLSLATGDHSVTVETYPEPNADTKVDLCLDEKYCSASSPSVQLQCEDDWVSDGGDSHCMSRDTLPPPCSLPSVSSSLTPRSEDFSSSLTLHSSALSVAPIHHHLSISHAAPPFFLSHEVSVGLATVAVDVHFHRKASTSRVLCSCTQHNCGSCPSSVEPPQSSPLSSLCQEDKQPGA